MKQAYRIWAEPTEEQRDLLSQWFGHSRFIYNRGLEARIKAWRRRRESLSST